MIIGFGRREDSTGAPKPHSAWTPAVSRHHDTFVLHLVDHPRGAVIADPEPALDHRDRRLPGLQHYTHGLVVKLIPLAAGAVDISLPGRCRFQDFHLIFA